MSESSEVSEQSDGRNTKHRGWLGALPALGCTAFLVAMIAAFFLWDFSEIIFARQQRQAALELITPGMRLTTAERELNKRHYITLYKSGPGGDPPVLDVGTCQRLPLTLQLIRKLFPQWHTPERVTDHLLARTHFVILADRNGQVKTNGNGRPAVELE